MRPCDVCDSCHLDFNAETKEYELSCLFGLDIKDSNETPCPNFSECQKDEVQIDIKNHDWDYIVKMSEKLNMSPTDFASKLVEQKLKKILEVSQRNEK